MFWASAKRGDWIFEQAEPLGGNGFWIIWTQLGLIGAPLFIWALVSFARAMTAWWLPAVTSIALFIMNAGAPNTMRVWTFMFVLLGVCHIMQPAAQVQRRVSPSRQPELQPQLRRWRSSAHTNLETMFGRTPRIRIDGPTMGS